MIQTINAVSATLPQTLLKVLASQACHGRKMEIKYWNIIIIVIQWSLYFKTTHGTKKMRSYIAGGLKIKGHLADNCPLGPYQVVLYYNQRWSQNRGL